MNVGSLFSGIGGFDLGFERAGMDTAFFVERDAYCQAVLRKHWPTVPVFDDVCTVGAHNLPAIDLLCGGFPCQDLSAAGKGAGLDGARSGLWSQFARLIGELRPRYVVVENVPVLRSRGLGRVLGEMAALGYDAEWDCVPAQAVGAPHRRDRIWIVAYPDRDGERGCSINAKASGSSQADGRCPAEGVPDLAYSERTGLEGHRALPGESEVAEPRDGGASADVGDAEGEHGWPGLREVGAQLDRAIAPDRGGDGGDQGNGCASHWTVEPDVGRVAHGVPSRVDRLRALGNALVPQIAEEIGRRILAHEQA